MFDRELGLAEYPRHGGGDLVSVGLYGSGRDSDGLLTIADHGDRSKAIWLAISKWDASKGGSFRAYMRRAMRWRMIDYGRERIVNCVVARWMLK